jgi:hypothetical protein
MQNITTLTDWVQQLLGAVLEPGAFAVDLTAGNGHDTSFLSRAVGPAGKVLSFDIQERAIEITADLLESEGAKVRRSDCSAASAPLPTGVTLICGDHAKWGAVTDERPRAITANLGYLPGGDKGVVTRAASSLSALQTGVERLSAGGFIAVICYVGHPGGRQEAREVEELFASLPSRSWRVLKLSLPNRDNPPLLLIAEKL